MSTGPAPASPELDDGQAPLITLDGQPLLDQWLRQLTGLRIDRGLGLVGRATLRFHDPGFAMSTSAVFALGKTVKLTTYKSAQTLLNGTVTGLTLEASDESSSELVVVVDDVAAKLRAPAPPSGNARLRPDELIKKLAQAYGMKADIEYGVLGEMQQEYLYQAGSVLGYLEALCARSGAVWWVDDTTLTVAGPSTSAGTAKATLGQQLVSFSVKATSVPQVAYEVRGWDITQKQAITSKVDKFDDQKTESVFAESAAGRSKAQGAPYYSLLRDTAPTSQSEAETMSKAMALQAASSAVVARGTCVGSGGLAPATDLTVEGAGPANGTYHVTRVEHVYGPAGFRTHFTAGPLRPTSLVDTLGPAAPEAGLRMDGVVVAIVTNNKDEKNMGRVKVKFPDLGDNVESTWARVAMVGAGASRGMFFLPEINDEVLVAFELGDTRRPLVLGGLYGGKTASPLTSDAAVKGGKVDKRTIVSREGHLIQLSDDPDDKHIQLKIKSGALIQIGDKKTTIDSSSKPIEIIGANGSIKIDDQGAITISGTSITLKATKNVQVEGLEVSAKASTSLKMEGGAEAGLKANGKASVESSGITEIKGSMVKIN